MSLHTLMYFVLPVVSWSVLDGFSHSEMVQNYNIGVRTNKVNVKAYRHNDTKGIIHNSMSYFKIVTGLKFSILDQEIFDFHIQLNPFRQNMHIKDSKILIYLGGNKSV